MSGIAIRRKILEGKKDDVIKSLTQTGGNLSASARAFGISRQTLYTFVKADNELMDLLAELREVTLDDAEGVLKEKAIEERDTASLIFFLKTQGRNRGYGNSVAVTGNDNGPIELKVVYENQ